MSDKKDNWEKKVEDLLIKITDASVTATSSIASAATEAIKVNNYKGAVDHDLLIRIQATMERVVTDIQDLTKGTSNQISDHELRIKKMETKQSNYFVSMAIYTTGILAVIGIILYHIFNGG